MLTKIFYTAVVGFWLWQEEIDCPNAAVCCPFVCSVSYRKCHFNAQVKAFLLSTFADLYDSFLISLPLFLCVFGSFHQFTSIKSVSLMSKTKTYFSHLAFNLDRVWGRWHSIIHHISPLHSFVNIPARKFILQNKQYTSVKERALYSTTMCFFNTFSGFNINSVKFFNRKTVSTDLTKPLIIPAGSDSFSQIGNLLKYCCCAVISSILTLRLEFATFLLSR